MSGMLGALPMWNDLFKSVGFNMSEFFEKGGMVRQSDETTIDEVETVEEAEVAEAGVEDAEVPQSNA